MIPFTLVTEENADMQFGYELCNGNPNTDVEKSVTNWRWQVFACRYWGLWKTNILTSECHTPQYNKDNLIQEIQQRPCRYMTNSAKVLRAMYTDSVYHYHAPRTWHLELVDCASK